MTRLECLSKITLDYQMSVKGVPLVATTILKIREDASTTPLVNFCLATVTSATLKKEMHGNLPPI